MVEPKLRDVMIELQKINRRLDNIEKQLKDVSKTVSPIQKTSPLVTTAPVDFSDQITTVTRFLDGTAELPAPVAMPEDHFCERTVDHKHILPIAWAGRGPIPCQLSGKNTGGAIK